MAKYGICVCVCVCVCLVHFRSDTQGLDRLQPDLSAACVIAQQYYSATLVSLRIHLNKEELGAHLKNGVI